VRLLSKKIIFTKIKDELLSFKYDNDKLVSIEYCDENNIVGNIYVGIVSEYLQNINAAFITFQDGVKGYYSCNDNTSIILNKKNTDKLCCGDRVLVQVSADKVKTKDYTLTSNITFTGEFIVLTVGRKGLSISKKITDNQFRNLLKDQLISLVTSEYGFILRTSCNKATIQEIMAEASELVNKYEQIKQKAESMSVGTLVYKAESDVIKIAKNNLQKDCEEIITDDINVYSQLIDCLPKYKGNIRLYSESYPIVKLYSLESRVDDCIKKKIWLDSGAYLLIEPTEALTVVDVNTGKAIKDKDREKFILKINIEAARAVSYELRKRNISGIIIIDFISMKSKDNENLLIETMKKYLLEDEVSANVAGITNLGLMEITRKRIKKPIHEIFRQED